MQRSARRFVWARSLGASATPRLAACRKTIRFAAAEALQYVADTPVSLHGRIELLWYVREQSVSHMYHRYGNLGFRGNEVRDEPA